MYIYVYVHVYQDALFQSIVFILREPIETSIIDRSISIFRGITRTISILRKLRTRDLFWIIKFSTKNVLRKFFAKTFLSSFHYIYQKFQKFSRCILKGKSYSISQVSSSAISILIEPRQKKERYSKITNPDITRIRICM